MNGAEGMTSPLPPAPGVSGPPPQKKGYVTFKIGTVVLLALLVLVSGNCHVVYGGGVGVTVCEKDGWYLSDTFVDLDDFIGKPLLANIDKARILRAMFHCEVLKRPEFRDR
jgi:hypothetical protein